MSAATSADTWYHVACHVAVPDPTRSKPGLRPDPDWPTTRPDPAVDWRSTTVDWWSAAVDRWSTAVNRWSGSGTRYCSSEVAVRGGKECQVAVRGGGGWPIRA
ncbi:hypothetical protein Tco_0245072 [Tanacetum coccineum]